MPTPWDLPARIRDRVRIDAASDCWLWIGARNERGYGRLSADGRLQGAHRVVYELLQAKIPAETPHMDHLCCHPPCVNPKHLEPVTPQENATRSANYLQKGPFPCGHPRAEENVYLLRYPGKDDRTCCATCQRERVNARYARKALAA